MAGSQARSGTDIPLAGSTVAKETMAMVSLFGFVRDVASQTRMSLALPGHPRLRNVMEALAGAQQDRLVERLMTSSGSLQPGVQILAGGQRLTDLDDPLPGSATVPVDIIVMQAAAGG